jgi:hypothetical protein
LWQSRKKADLFRGFSSIFLLVTRLSEGVGEPLETLVETVTGGGTGGLDVLSGVKMRD